MSILFVAAALQIEKKKKEKEKVRRRELRDSFNPTDIIDSAFVSIYRINKAAFQMLMTIVGPHLHNSTVPARIQLATTLRFLAKGTLQREIGKDSTVALAQGTVSKVLTQVLDVMERKICKKWIKLTMSNDEINKSKSYFLKKYGIPGVEGCVDGTHIPLTQPRENGSIFYNKRGFYSVNAMIICDYDMRIRAVDACRPGSNNDSLIWNTSKERAYFRNRFENGERGTWLLADAEYALEPFVITPYKNAEPGTVNDRFNKKHFAARSVVMRTIKVLKSRFQRLTQPLPYQPRKVVQITNVCCALHNICRRYNVAVPEYELNEENNDIGEDEIFEDALENKYEMNEENDDINEDEIFEDEFCNDEIANKIRDDIANSINVRTY